MGFLTISCRTCHRYVRSKRVGGYDNFFFFLERIFFSFFGFFRGRGCVGHIWIDIDNKKIITMIITTMIKITIMIVIILLIIVIIITSNLPIFRS
jgi:hypothetical protein